MNYEKMTRLNVLCARMDGFILYFRSMKNTMIGNAINAALFYILSLR